jgi:hypothetical protein
MLVGRIVVEHHVDNLAPHAQPFTTSAAIVDAHHVRGRPGLVDEDEACRVEIDLEFEPRFALAHHVGTVLLDCVTCLSFRVKS